MKLATALCSFEETKSVGYPSTRKRISTAEQLDWLSAVTFCPSPRLSATAVALAVLIRAKVNAYGYAFFSDEFAESRLSKKRKSLWRARQELFEAGFLLVSRHSTKCSGYHIRLDAVSSALEAADDRKEQLRARQRLRTMSSPPAEIDEDDPAYIPF